MTPTPPASGGWLHRTLIPFSSPNHNKKPDIHQQHDDNNNTNNHPNHNNNDDVAAAVGNGRRKKPNKENVLLDLLIVQLTPPLSSDETCPISMQPMAANDDATTTITTPMMVFGRPELCCIQLPCGHRFQGASLLLHFALHDMRCPLCRAGHAHRRMSPIASFPGEGWARALERRALEKICEEEAATDDDDDEEDDEEWTPHHRFNNNNDNYNNEDRSSSSAEAEGRRRLHRTLMRLQEVVLRLPLVASVSLFTGGRTEGSPTLIQQFPLRCESPGVLPAFQLLTMRPRYSLPAFAIQSLAYVMSSLTITAIRVEVLILTDNDASSSSSNGVVSLQASIVRALRPAETVSLLMHGSRLWITPATVSSSSIAAPSAPAPSALIRSFLFVPSQSTMEHLIRSSPADDYSYHHYDNDDDVGLVVI